TVSVTVNFAGTKVATVTTSATGTFSTSFKVPKSEPPGSYSVAATAGAASASGKFTVRTNATMFRYNLALTGVDPSENVLNASNVSGLQTSWTESTSGAVGISPAVVNGSVYVSANNGFFVYNASTGKLLWSHPGVFFTTSSPAVSGGMVYVAGADGNFYAFSTTVSSGTAPAPRPPVAPFGLHPSRGPTAAPYRPRLYRAAPCSCRPPPSSTPSTPRLERSCG